MPLLVAVVLLATALICSAFLAYTTMLGMKTAPTWFLVIVIGLALICMKFPHTWQAPALYGACAFIGGFGGYFLARHDRSINTPPV